MSTTITVDPTKKYRILLGRQMTYGVNTITFDLSALVSEFGEGVATIVHQRCRDTAPYIVCSSESGDTSLEWVVSETDTAYKGIGWGELRYVVTDGMEKTVTFNTVTQPSLTGDETVPDALESWYDAMIAYIDENTADASEYAEQAADSAEAAADSATEAATILANCAQGAGLTLSMTDGILTITED